MLIYTHNLPQKLFGFAYSREALQYNTDLCSLLEDPDLSFEIDLAIDLNNSLRGDIEAARRLTNNLVLSSSNLDFSTLDFYSFKMEQYPIFEREINRINSVFQNIDDLSQYTPVDNDDSDFVDKLKNALEDCLNSPCNPFSQTSDSIGSMANFSATMNSTTMPTFGELKDQFVNAVNSVPQTIFKKVPTAVQDCIIEMAQLFQEAYSRSVEMAFARDSATRSEIISKASGGNAIASDSKGYKYVPDLQTYLNTSELASDILTKVAEDLGGCNNKFQHVYRYEPYNPEHNLSRTSSTPITNSVGDDTFQMNFFGKVERDYNRTDDNLGTCFTNQDVYSSGGNTGSISAPTVNLKGSREDYYKNTYRSVYNAAIKKGLTPQQSENLARVGAAQASLESNYGKSGLSSKYNNHFGIKGTGPAGTAKLRDRFDGMSNFRAYNNFDESASDYVNLMTKYKRYDGVVNAESTDAAVAALGRSGYSTDPSYGSKVQSLVNGGKASIPPTESLSNSENNCES